MNEDVDEIYRRASALDPSRPSEAVRRKVLEHAAALAAQTPVETSTQPAPQGSRPPRTTANSARWRPAIFGTLAAAGLAGLLVIPRVFNPHPTPASMADTAARQIPPGAAAPTAGSTPPQVLRSRAPEEPPPIASNERPALPSMGGPSMAKALPRSADESRLGAPPVDAPRLDESAARSGAAAANTRASTRQATAPTDAGAALRRAAEIGDVRGLQDLLTGQVDVDARDSGGRTALMAAAASGQAKSVDVLLAHGADPNAVDRGGMTPLESALRTHQPAIAAALRRAGAR